MCVMAYFWLSFVMENEKNVITNIHSVSIHPLRMVIVLCVCLVSWSSFCGIYLVRWIICLGHMRHKIGKHKIEALIRENFVTWLRQLERLLFCFQTSFGYSVCSREPMLEKTNNKRDLHKNRIYFPKKNHSIVSLLQYDHSL